MAGIVSGNKSADKTPAPAEPVKPTGFQIVDEESIPDSSTRNMSENPFQEKINELAKTGKAASVVVPTEDEETIRAQIRRAAGNIGKGGHTVPEKVPGRDDVVKIWFRVKEKRARKPKTS